MPKKNSCNYLDLLLAKVAKSCNHLCLSLAKVAKSCNHLELLPAKVVLMFFCQKLSRFIASKSWEKLQSFQFIPSKNVQKVQSFRFIFSKTLKNVTNFCNQLNLPPANVFFFGEREGKNHVDLSRAKIQKKCNFGK